MPDHQIPDDVVRKVTSALNAAIGIASVYAPSMQSQLLDAAHALDDAVNGVLEEDIDYDPSRDI